MSAKEMFEELGYVEDEKRTSMCAIKVYENIKTGHRIYFDYDKKIDYWGAIIDLTLLKAINKQIEELGWNE